MNAKVHHELATSLLMAVMARGAAIDFLLASEEPANRCLTRHDVLREDVTPDRDETLSVPLVRGLLRGQKRDGGFGGHAYQKWGGAHWRLVSLVELGVPPDDRLRLPPAPSYWLTSDGHRGGLAGQQRRGRRLGRTRAERDDHAERCPHPQGRGPAGHLS
jgi:hypothetical protein